MSEHQAYTYYAFVSYSHKDEKWGKWIQSALEHYRLPAVVRKEVGKPLPQKIHPVFRDDTDLGACRLEAGLQQELEQSRFLIVVCSPNSAKPNAEGRHWVNEEVKRFCDMGRTDNIIPVIVEGTKETSFCPKLAEINNIGPDATKQSKARVLNNLVAKILGLRPDELWRREERRLRAKRRLRTIAVAAVAALVAFGGYVWWDCTRTVTRAFADYVDSYGLPEGIFPLTPEQVSHRHVHYRFEFRGYRYGKSIHADSAAPSLLRALGFQRVLRKVEHSDAERLQERHEHDVIGDLQFTRPLIQAFRYGRNGRLVSLKGDYPASGGHAKQSVVARFDWTDDSCSSAIVRFLNPESKKSTFAPLALRGVPDDYGTGGKVFAWMIDFDDHGRYCDLSFLDAEDHVIDSCGMGRSISHEGWNATYEGWDRNAGLCFKVDGIGRIIEVRLKGPRSGLPGDKSLVLSYYRSETDMAIRLCPLNEADSKAHFLTISFDSCGRAESVRFSNEETHCLFRPGYDSEAWKGSYVELETRYERTMYTTKEHNPAGWNSVYDEQGNEIERRFVDISGNLAFVDNGYAGWNSQFDNRHREIKRICVGLDGQPITVEAGPVGWSKCYGDTNVVFSFLGPDLNPFFFFCKREHFAIMESVFDAGGHEIRRIYRDAAMKPRIQPDGYAGWTSAYDAFENETNTLFLGITLLPKNLPEGYAGYSTKFDEVGRAVSRRYFDEHGNFCTNHNGFAGWDKHYDWVGRVTNRLFFAETGRLTLVTKNGLEENTGPIAGWWKDFSVDGELMEIGTIGTNGLPMVNRLGWASKKFVKNGELWFDEHGNSIFHPHPSQVVGKTFGSSPFEKTTWWHDEETGKRVRGNDGTFGHRELFNEVGESTNLLYLGENGEPCISKYGYAECRMEYKAQYKPTRTAYYDMEGNLATNQQGYAVQIETWDEYRKDTSVQWYDTNGNLVQRYPEEGVAYRLYEFYPPPWEYQESSMTNIGTNGLPVNSNKGYSRIEYDATPDHSKLGSLYYSADGTPFHFKGGHSGFLELRDHHYNVTNFFYLGAYGKPIMNTEKEMASYTTEYDYSLGTLEKDRRIKAQFFFNENGNSIAKKTGEAGWRDKFDDYGRQIERTYFGTNGLPVMTKYGFATRQMFYDETTGMETNRVLLDADGTVIQPKTMEKKKYSWKPHYDEAGSLIKETYESEDGTLGRDSLWSKASSIEYQYDSNGMETNRVYRGIHGEPILCDRWPVNKNSTPGRYWRGEEGYFELRQTYDAQGRLAEKSFWNTNGMAMLCSVGVHIMRYEYDEAGRVIEIRNFGVDGLPCADREGVHVERRIFSEDGEWVDTTRTAPDGTTRLCKWATKVVKTVAPDSFAERLGAHPGDRWVRLGDHIFAEAFLSTNNSDGLVSFVQWEERMRQSSIDPNWVSILAKKAGDDFIIVAFSSKELTLSALGFENEHDKTRPMEQEGATLLTRAVEWLKTSTPEAISVDDRNGN